MDSTLLGGVFSGISELLGKFIPDKDTLVQAQLELAKLQDGAAERADNLESAQVDVDKIEASNPNLFVSGWRPFIGWVGGITLAYSFLVAPFIHMFVPHQPIPTVDSSMIMDMVYALLGIGGMRTVEKLSGVATAQALPPNIAAPQNIVTRTIGKWFK